MKIIHTADWHLCDRLGRLNRTDDLKAHVERVAALCEEHAADVLIVAGDLFSEQASVDDITMSLNHVKDTFRAFFARGGTLLAITGNHDRDGKINLVRAGMTLAMPDAGRGGVLPGGRMYIVNSRVRTTLAGADGSRVQFVLVPYPTSSRYGLSATEYQSKEGENRVLHARVAEWVQQVSTQSDFAVSLPTVLVAHLHVRGAEVHTVYRMDDRDDVLFDFADLNPMWAYVALGHIHKPQAVNGQSNVRYPGSLDRLDFGESHDDHGVLLLEVNGSNAVEPVRLPIPATAFHTVTITDPETELATLAEKYPDHETAIVRITVTRSGTHLSRDEITRQLRKLFPRHAELKWADTAREGGTDTSTTFSPRAGFEPTVRNYLTEKLANEPDKEAILALADTFLHDAGDA